MHHFNQDENLKEPRFVLKKSLSPDKGSFKIMQCIVRHSLISTKHAENNNPIVHLSA